MPTWKTLHKRNILKQRKRQRNVASTTIKTKEKANVFQMSSPVVLAALSATLCRLSIREEREEAFQGEINLSRIVANQT